jgi:hypothetical protein
MNLDFDEVEMSANVPRDEAPNATVEQHLNHVIDTDELHTRTPQPQRRPCVEFETNPDGQVPEDKMNQDSIKICNPDHGSNRQVSFSLQEVPTVIAPEPNEMEQDELTSNKTKRRSHHDHEAKQVVDHHKKEEELKNHSASLSFFTKPIQRQRWGDIQLKPHTNWGDIFFDLFYVASAYNLGNLLRFDPTWRGLLYFAGCLAPIQMLWFTKLRYDSRFFTRADIWHQGYEVAVLLVLSTMVLHIRPDNILSNPSAYNDMFVFALSLVIAQILVIGRHLEILFAVEGDEAAAKFSARNEIRHELISITFYVTATVIAAVKFYGSDHELAMQTVTTNDIPIWLCLAGSLASVVWLVFVVLFWLPKGGNHKK